MTFFFQSKLLIITSITILVYIYKRVFGFQLFESIKKRQPKLFEKVSAIIGDCSLPNLGLTKYDQEIIQSEVSDCQNCDNVTNNYVIISLFNTKFYNILR